NRYYVGIGPLCLPISACVSGKSDPLIVTGWQIGENARLLSFIHRFARRRDRRVLMMSQGGLTVEPENHVS
ncbi:TPA: hypothetical protein ACKFTR_004662, partial [Enterobacter kobei]